MIANVYIDGLNLYYGIKEWPGCKWLDVGALVHSLFPDDDVNRIRYFTARVKGKLDPSSVLRQQAYLRALSTIPNLELHYGTLLVTQAMMPLAEPIGGRKFARVIKTEEKGSDVNLGVHMMLDAFNRNCEMAVVISNDSDLREPIRLVQAEPFNVVVWVINPHRFRTQMGSTRHLDLKRTVVEACLFPMEVDLPNGKIVTCPEKWRRP